MLFQFLFWVGLIGLYLGLILMAVYSISFGAITALVGVTALCVALYLPRG